MHIHCYIWFVMNYRFVLNTFCEISSFDSYMTTFYNVRWIQLCDNKENNWTESLYFISTDYSYILYSLKLQCRLQFYIRHTYKEYYINQRTMRVFHELIFKILRVLISWLNNWISGFPFRRICHISLFLYIFWVYWIKFKRINNNDFNQTKTKFVFVEKTKLNGNISWHCVLSINSDLITCNVTSTYYFIKLN